MKSNVEIMADTDIEPPPNPWEIILLWTGASGLFIFVGILFGAFLNDSLWNYDLPLCVGNCISINLVVNFPIHRAFVFGLSIGTLQGLWGRLILQKWKIKWNGWLPASIAGWALGATIAIGLEFFRWDSGINPILGGMVIGLAQWVVLRRYLPKAYWWIIANVIGCFAVFWNFPLGYTFSMMLETFIVFIAEGIFVGIMTSAMLSWLLNLSWLENQ